MRYIINTDGGSRGNPGPAGIGYVIKLQDETLVREGGDYIGEATNNVAEYKAAIAALENLKKLVPKPKRKSVEVEVRMDSELIVKQLNDLYQIKEESLFPHYIALHNLKVSEFPKTSFKHVRRAENARADELVNQAIDEYAKK